MATEKLKCQFCALGFTSVYKIIPHVYFGHRKKISRYVRDHDEVRLKCPSGCGFSHGVPVDKTAGPEVVFPVLSKVFLEMEDHMVTQHTKEQKLTMCPYCQKSLDGLVYWEHLEEHMGSNATPSTPTAARTGTTPSPSARTGTTPSPSPRTPTTPVTPVKPNASPKEISPVIKESSPLLKSPVKQELSVVKDEKPTSPVAAAISSVESENEKSPRKILGFATEAGQVDSATDAALSSIVQVATDHTPPRLDAQVACDRKPSDTSGSITIKAQPTESFEQKKIKYQNNVEIVKSPKVDGKNDQGDSSEEVVGFLESVNFENLHPRVTKISEPLKAAIASPKAAIASPKDVSPKVSKLSKDEAIVNQLKEIERKIALKRKENEKRKAQQGKNLEEGKDHDQVKDALDSFSPDFPSSNLTSTAAPSTVETEKIVQLAMTTSDNTEVKDKSSPEGAKSASKGKVLDQRKAKIEKDLAEIERKIKEKKEEEKRKETEEKLNAREIPDIISEVSKPEALVSSKNIDKLEEKRITEKDRHTAAGEWKDDNIKKDVEGGDKAESRGEQDVPKRSREVSGEQELIKRSRDLSGDQDASKVGRSRNASGDKKNTKSVWSRETSRERGVEESGRRSASQESKDSQDRARDSNSQERRDSSSRRLSGGDPVVKQKPVLTEEMERKIIYGGFTKKKETREDKLNAVKREIESRFKEEEQRKLKVQAEKRKAEEKEREKQRLNDEKLRKEREKLREEKKKLKDAEKAAKENEEVSAMLEEKDPEPTTNETPEEPSEEVSMENTPKSSPPQSREKSPDQYQKIKMEIMKIDIEIEKKQAALHSDKKRKGESRSPSPAEMASPPKLTKPSSPVSTRKVPGVHELPKPPKAPLPKPDSDDEMDDLEMMMRDFQEREAKERLAEISNSQPPADSLSQLRDSYAAPKAKSTSPSPPPVEKQKPTIPSGFDQDGHPLPLAPLSTLGQDPVLVKAANNAARGIMGPARSMLQSHTLQLQCSVCKEEGPSASYHSAYQLLSHVFLAHRKKIVSRSRKARGMTLACPEGCGFTTTSSTQGVSIDFFNGELPLHLASLCEHIISSHTGEDRMNTCQFCSLPLDHEHGWSWQHLANHRDARRVYCSSCNNFPFKNEEHKCSGLPDQGGSNSPFARNTPSPAGAISTTTTPRSDKTTSKSLEELAREVESGVIKPEELSKQRHLGSVSVWVCGVCDQTSSALSGWVAHTRTHLPTQQLKLPNHLKCFCCQWRPARFERGSEVVALQQLINHLLAEHNNQAWSDQKFEIERGKVDQMMKDYEKRIQREKEEKDILVPKLPHKCTNCKEVIEDSKTWKYHVLAHKFGEVFCATCMKCVLGHQFSEHKIACTSNKKGVAKARVEKYRGDTWLDVGGKKLKVFFEYDENEDLGRVTIAKCMVKGNLPMMGVGVNHEEAANVLKEEVEDYFSTLKEQEDTVNKEKSSQEDRQALIDMFVELVKIDQENAIDYFLTVGGVESPVNTRMEFTKLGKVQIVAIVEVKGELITEIGNTRKEAVNNLARKIERAESEKQSKGAKFCCVDCGSRFSKEVAFKLHQNIRCRV